MKKLMIVALLIACLCVTANAMTLSAVTIGDEDQYRVNGVTGTLQITNTNNSTALTNVALTSTAASKYNVRFSGPVTIAAGATESYTVTIDIPDDHNGVDDSLKEAAIKVGQIIASGKLGAASDSGTSDLLVQAVNQLRIDKVRVVCDTKSQSVSDNDKVKSILPGQSCSIEISVENNFDDKSDSGEKIDDVEFATMRFTIDSSSGDVDVDIDDEFDDLAPNDNDVATGTIDIDEEADRDATISLEVSAIDENGAKHGEALSFKIEVKRLTHDVQIRRVQASPETLDNCEDMTVRVTVNVLNMGKRDESDAAVELSVKDLDYVKKEIDLELDKDDSRTVMFDIPVPKGTAPGLYSIDVRSFYDSIAPSDLAPAEFTVTECEDVEPVVIVDDGSDKTVVVDDTVTTSPPPISPSASSAKVAPTKSGTSALYVTLLIILNLLLLAAIVVVVVLFTQKKK